MWSLKLTDVRKSFGDAEVVHGIDLAASPGEFVVFVGPSGCGKSTLLRMIAGLEDTSAGSIEIGGRDVTDADPAQRGIAMVFQSYALYPHMSVRQNMGFGLKMGRVPAGEVARRVAAAAEILQLDQLLDRKPRQLSGGQRQRVAIGRAIVREPEVFLFDEPLSNLDAELRVQMRLEISKLHRRLQATMVYVTHDQVEAMTLADRIVVLRDGRIEQVGAPQVLFDDPDNVFVAGFIGSPKMNIVQAEVVSARDNAALVRSPVLGSETLSVATRAVDLPAGTPCRLGFRPEHARIEADPAGAAEVRLIETLGSIRHLYADVGALSVVVQASDEPGQPPAGSRAHLRPEAARCFLFDEAGQRL